MFVAYPCSELDGTSMLLSLYVGAHRMHTGECLMLKVTSNCVNHAEVKIVVLRSTILQPDMVRTDVMKRPGTSRREQ